MHLIMFDIDGTLVDSYAYDTALYKASIKAVLDIDCPDDWEGISHMTDTGILAEVYTKAKNKDLSQKDHDLVRDHFIDSILDTLGDNPDQCQAISGGIKLISQLRENENYQIAIATGGWGPSACFKLSSAGYDLTDLVMATGDDHFDRMEIMLLARERAEEKLPDGEGFETVTYIGDGQWDKLATEGLGWRFIGIGDMVKDAALHINDFKGADQLIMGVN